jgi:thermostable 8-oxoguanine DNA glycosylase
MSAITLSLIRDFYKTHRSKYQEFSLTAASLGKASNADVLFRTLCVHLLGSGAVWEKAMHTVDYLSSVGVLRAGDRTLMEKALRECNYGNKYFGPRKAANVICQNRENLYDTGSIVLLVRLLDSVSQQDPILARNVLAHVNTGIEVRISGADISLKNVYINGIGVKWASHFLRELGFSHDQLAILDFHIVDQLVSLGVIGQRPRLLSAKTYLAIEQVMKDWARREVPEIPLDHLDLVLFDLDRASGGS